VQQDIQGFSLDEFPEKLWPANLQNPLSALYLRWKYI